MLPTDTFSYALQCLPMSASMIWCLATAATMTTDVHNAGSPSGDARVPSMESGYRLIHCDANSIESCISAARSTTNVCVIASPALGPSAAKYLVASLADTSAMLFLMGSADSVAVKTCLAAQEIRPTSCFLGKSGRSQWISVAIQRRGEIDAAGFLLHAWHAAIGGLPTKPRIELCSELAGNSVPRCSAEFVKNCGGLRRTVERSFFRADLPGIARTLSAVRLARAWRLLQNDHLSVARVAQLTGFGSERTFARVCLAWLGSPPSATRQWTARVLADTVIAFTGSRSQVSSEAKRRGTTHDV
jgi:AraC-like DNA-binding protein